MLNFDMRINLRFGCDWSISGVNARRGNRSWLQTAIPLSDSQRKILRQRSLHYYTTPLLKGNICVSEADPLM